MKIVINKKQPDKRDKKKKYPIQRRIEVEGHGNRKRKRERTTL
jgi:hypothetical protein